MKVKEFLLVTFIFVLALVCVAGCAGPKSEVTPTSTAEAPVASAPQVGKVYNWTFILGVPLAADPTKADWGKRIAELSGGRLQIKILQPGEHPYSLADALRVSKEKLGEIMNANCITSLGSEPMMGLAELPFLFNGYQEIVDMLANPEFADIRDGIITKPLARWDAIALCQYGFPDYFIATKDRFFDSMDALKGKTIRTVNTDLANMVQALGGIPVNVAMADVYTNLQKGMLDGVMSGFAPSVNLHWFEVCKYVTFTSHNTGLGFICVNKDAWASLPQDLQKIVLQASAEFEKANAAWCLSQTATMTLPAMNQQGARLMAMPPDLRAKVRDAMAPVWDKWVERTGPPAGDMLKRVEEFHKKWVATH